jgi:hypothetical protein
MTSTTKTTTTAQADARFAELGKDHSVIPTGCYCYTPLDASSLPVDGSMTVKTCPFWASSPDHEKQMSGYCALMRAGDWEDDGTMLLWDMVKECGIKDDIDPGLCSKNASQMSGPLHEQAHDAEAEAAEEHPCCFCNDEGSMDGTGEVHPCTFCGSY